ncbi:MAG: hypothetical protein GY870_18560 [archaeon]|nr:hypothetical protein [archaeon]
MTGRGLAEEICIWKDESECEDCNLHHELFCRPKSKYILYFGIPAFIAMIPAGIGILFSDFNIITRILIFGGWISYLAFFFFIWESRMVCNHCPYFANDEQRTLHCPIDKGKLKTSKYNPGPSSISEKIQFIVGLIIFIGYPSLFLLLAGQFLLLFFSLGAFIGWIIIIQLKVCTDCVNFACVLNRVPKSIRLQFFEKNPIIKKAWEEKGKI